MRTADELLRCKEINRTAHHLYCWLRCQGGTMQRSFAYIGTVLGVDRRAIGMAARQLRDAGLVTYEYGSRCPVLQVCNVSFAPTPMTEAKPNSLMKFNLLPNPGWR